MTIKRRASAKASLTVWECLLCQSQGSSEEREAKAKAYNGNTQMYMILLNMAYNVAALKLLNDTGPFPFVNIYRLSTKVEVF